MSKQALTECQAFLTARLSSFSICQYYVLSTNWGLELLYMRHLREQQQQLLNLKTAMLAVKINATGIGQQLPLLRTKILSY